MFVRSFTLSTLALVGACHRASDSPTHSPTEPTAATAQAPSVPPSEPRAAESRATDWRTGESRAADSSASGNDLVKSNEPRASGLPRSWPAVEATARAPWCSEGLTTLDESSCYVLPAVPTRTLLIYLHGIVPPRDESPEKTKVQTVILKAAQRAGVVALVPRGRPGFGPMGRRSWVGWPTTDPLYEKHATDLVAQFAAAQKKLEALTGVTFSPVYLAGSSSGAYFVTRLALHGGIDVDGFGAMSGGTGTETLELSRLPPKPFYIGYGKYDGYVRRAIPTLVGVLNRVGWPIRVAEHAVDHGAREVYLEEAFAFWREQGH